MQSSEVLLEISGSPTVRLCDRRKIGAENDFRVAEHLFGIAGAAAHR